MADNRKKNIDKYFITKAAYFSMELNAHNLLYLVFLVQQNKLPKQAAMNVHLYNSQGCESLFRDARSLSGSFSTIVNFTVSNFLRRSLKLSLLNQLKSDQADEKLLFPLHHKRKGGDLSVACDQRDEIHSLNVKQIISEAFNEAIRIVKHSKILDDLQDGGVVTLDALSKSIFNHLKTNSKMFRYQPSTEDEDMMEFDLDNENEDFCSSIYDNDDDDQVTDDDENDVSDENVHNDVSLDSNDEDNDDMDILNTQRSNFNGIRIIDKVNKESRQAYFKVRINGKIKYIHKQSAAWLLSNSITKLSNDRLCRVMQQTT